MTEPPPIPETPPERPPERSPFWGYSDLLLFIGIAIPCMLLGLGLVKGSMFLLRIQTPVRAMEILVPQFIGFFFLFGALMLMFRAQYGRPFWVSLGWVEPRLGYLTIIFSGIGTAIAVNVLAYLIGTPTTTNPMLELLKDRVSVIAVAIFGVTVGPLCEELAFRGFIQPLLVRSLGTVPGILAAALPFGLLHIQQYGNSWRHVVVIAIAGVAFGWMRHVTGSTKAATIMHASYNALFFVALMLLGIEGGKEGAAVRAP